MSASGLVFGRGGDALVSGEVMPSSESLQALGAIEGTLSAVNQLMRFELVRVAEFQVA